MNVAVSFPMVPTTTTQIKIIACTQVCFALLSFVLPAYWMIGHSYAMGGESTFRNVSAFRPYTSWVGISWLIEWLGSFVQLLSGVLLFRMDDRGRLACLVYHFVSVAVATLGIIYSGWFMINWRSMTNLPQVIPVDGWLSQCIMGGVLRLTLSMTFLYWLTRGYVKAACWAQPAVVEAP